MGQEKESFIHFNRKTQRFEVDDRKINLASLLSTRWLLHALEPTRQYGQGRLLDIGCGTKPYREFYAAQQHIGIDWPGSTHALSVDAFANAQALPFVDSSFDVVLCTEVIEHLPSFWLAIEDIARVLKPGGYLILSAPFVHILHEQPYDHYRFTVYGLLELTRQFYMEPVAIWQRGGIGSVVFDQATRFFSILLRAVMRRLYFPKTLQDGILRIVITFPQRLVAWLVISPLDHSKRQGSNKLTNPSLLSFGYVLVARRVAVKD